MESGMPSPAEWCVVLDGSSVPDREDVGNKARGIALMRSQGLPVPPAFVLPTHVGRRYIKAGNTLPDEACGATVQAVRALESQTGRRFGSAEDTLLVSVRSGAAQSMPGMMDTILNLGINDEIEAGIAAESGDAAFARDTHLRFLEAYAKTVLGARVAHAESPAAIREAIGAAAGTPVPEDPYEQLRGAIGAVFLSWTSPRAQAYRRHWGIPEEGGTAVTVQAMVFGNLDERSGTGVFFTRNPHSGAREPYGEFLPRGQGEDVVSGEVQPLDLEALRERMPEIHAALLEAGRTLEQDARDVQEIEFTVERGRLYLLQTRSAKRSPAAALQLAVDLVEDGLALPEKALGTIRGDHVEAVLKPTIDPDQRASAEVLAKGEPASPGIAAGLAVTDADEAESVSEDGTEVVLVTKATRPEDIHGMIAATGIVTEIGGRTSHAAVVSRELGRPAVVGCGAGAVQRLAGKLITIDGETGEVFAGELAMRTPVASEHPHLAKLTTWAAEHRDKLPVDHPLLAHLPQLSQS
jgi:pyruvate,orthophosphate dikinase